MPYIDEMVSKNISENWMAGELSQCTIDSIQMIEPELASISFPGVTLPKSPSLASFKFAFCHSLPKSNKRGRAFTPQVLDNSFGSLNDQLIDYEHNLEANGVGGRDKVVGHVKATHFTLPPELASAALNQLSLASMAPLAAYGLGVLYLRTQSTMDVIRGHLQKKQKWKVSMECGHNWKDACLWYENEFIPVDGAELAMKNCVGPHSVKDYKGRPLALCLGGMNKSVDFWGLGLTTSPADADANILAFMGGSGQELASKKTFYAPLFSFSEQGVEVASTDVDKKIEDFAVELASICVIGETDGACMPGDAAGGHKHKVLSNLQVVPSGGHAHSLHSFVISQGTNPRLTGVTDSHYHSPVSSGNSHIHNHTVDVNLGKKYSLGDTETPPRPGLESVSYPLSEEASMKLEELMAKLTQLATDLASATIGSNKDAMISQINALKLEVASITQSQAISDANKKFLADEIAAGRVLMKEVADEAVTTAVADALKETTAKHEADLAAAKKRADRLQRLTEARIDLDTKFEGIKGMDGKDVTLRSRVDMMPLDATGDQMFEMDFTLWSQSEDLKIPVVPDAGTPAAAAAAAAAGTPVQGKEAASAKPRRVIAAAGGGASGSARSIEDIEAELAAAKLVKSGTGKEVANATIDTPKHLKGRSALSKV